MPIDAITVDEVLHYVHFLVGKDFYLLVFCLQLTLRLNLDWFRPWINDLKLGVIVVKKHIQSILSISLSMINNDYPSILYSIFNNPFGFSSFHSHLQLVLHGIFGLNHDLALGLNDSNHSLAMRWRKR